jgi:predicted RNase H-like HicB family nuclease/DNA-binding XRE family transcriptional regulator
MKYHFKIKKEKNGFVAMGIELPGCITQGDNYAKLLGNLAEALDLYLDEPADSKIIFPFPKKKVLGKNVIEVSVNSRVAFAFSLRMMRLRRQLTQRQAAELIGLTGSLNNYQRLENSSTANPVLETLVLIKRAFPEFPIEQVAS